jgi:hypothetical protein
VLTKALGRVVRVSYQPLHRSFAVFDHLLAPKMPWDELILTACPIVGRAHHRSELARKSREFPLAFGEGS